MVNYSESSELLAFLRDHRDGERVPPLKDLSAQLKISVSRLREQLEVAKTMGFVAVRPRVGIRRLDYSFTPAVRSSLDYAIQLDHRHFEQYLDLRRHLEDAYFIQAGQALQPEDHQELERLIAQAWEKLRGRPVRIPHQEHRHFHLTIYRRLDNVFVSGLIEAYWDAYETVGLNVYADLAYLENVWSYHERVAASLASGELKKGKRLMQEHFDLLIDRLAS
jgi:DNA-binding FadR family transcriptional regulator